MHWYVLQGMESVSCVLNVFVHPACWVFQDSNLNLASNFSKNSSGRTFDCYEEMNSYFEIHFTLLNLLMYSLLPAATKCIFSLTKKILKKWCHCGIGSKSTDFLI